MSRYLSVETFSTDNYLGIRDVWLFSKRLTKDKVELEKFKEWFYNMFQKYKTLFKLYEDDIDSVDLVVELVRVQADDSFTISFSINSINPSETTTSISMYTQKMISEYVEKEELISAFTFDKTETDNWILYTLQLFSEEIEIDSEVLEYSKEELYTRLTNFLEDIIDNGSIPNI